MKIRFWKELKNLIKNNRIEIIELELIFSEIYEKSLQIYDIEKNLIPHNYKLFLEFHKVEIYHPDLFTRQILCIFSR